MSLIKELFEAANTQPVELKDLAAAYPKNLAKAVHAIWSTRLHFQGKSWEEFYKHIDEMGEDFIKESDGWFTKDFEIVYDGDDDYLEESFDVNLEIDSCQEVYFGFSSKTPDTVYIGYDVWWNEEEVWQPFYKAFKKMMKVSYNEDDTQHEIIADHFWKEQVLPGQMFGVLLKVKCSNGEQTKISVAINSSANIGKKAGGFYKTIYKSPEFKELGLTDLRLD